MKIVRIEISREDSESFCTTLSALYSIVVFYRDNLLSIAIPLKNRVFGHSTESEITPVIAVL